MIRPPLLVLVLLPCLLALPACEETKPAGPPPAPAGSPAPPPGSEPPPSDADVPDKPDAWALTHAYSTANLKRFGESLKKALDANDFKLFITLSRDVFPTSDRVRPALRADLPPARLDYLTGSWRTFYDMPDPQIPDFWGIQPAMTNISVLKATGAQIADGSAGPDFAEYRAWGADTLRPDKWYLLLRFAEPNARTVRTPPLFFWDAANQRWCLLSSR